MANDEKNPSEGQASADMRAAFYYLSILRNNLECARLAYMKRYEDSGKILDNEKAKATHVQCDITTIDRWLKRNEAYAVDPNLVSHLNADYSFKEFIEF